MQEEGSYETWRYSVCRITRSVPRWKAYQVLFQLAWLALSSGQLLQVQGVGRYTSQTLGGMKDYGVGKVGDVARSHYGQLTLGTVDSLLDVTEDLVDHYLPPLLGMVKVDLMFVLSVTHWLIASLK